MLTNYSNNPFLILCSGSSGSTLLSVLLDKHPLIACGPEIGVFNKPDFYNTPFNEFQRKFPSWLNNGLPTDGHVRIYSFFFNKEAYFQTEESLNTLVQNSNSLKDFIDNFYKDYLNKRGKKIWGEKTGSNAYCILEFLKLYPNAKIIHLVRDPRDTVCSLYNRAIKVNNYESGFAAVHAVSHWLYNNAASLQVKDLDNYMLVRYEDLVNQPKKVMKDISSHLEISYTEKFFSPEIDNYWKNFSEGNVHKSWTNTPLGGKLSNKSIGKYKTELNNDLKHLICKLHLRPSVLKKLNVPYKNIASIMKELGYEDASLHYTFKFKNVVDVYKYNFSRIKREWKIRKKLVGNFFFIKM